MAMSICVGSIIDTLHKLRPFFKQFPLDRIEIDLFPDGDPEFYFAFDLKTSDQDCERHLQQLHDARLDIQLASSDREPLTQTLYDKSRELAQLFYPVEHAWSVCTVTYAPIAELYKEVDDETHLPEQYSSSEEIGFRIAMEVPARESSNEVEVELFYGTASLLVEDFSLKNGTLH